MSDENHSHNENNAAANGWGTEKTNRSHFHGLWALTNRDLKKWYKIPALVVMTLIQPIIWLGLFGQSLNFGKIFAGGSFNIPGFNIPKATLDQLSNEIMKNTFGTTDYFSFLAVGMLSFVILFTTMFGGMSVVWDRRFGFLDKVLSTPVSRGAIVMGKVFGTVVRALLQAAVVLVVAVLMSMDVSHFSVLSVSGTFVGLFLMSIGFSSLFLMLALRSTDWQSQMAIMNLLNLPLLFGSNALFPASFMPWWLQDFVAINPITYATDVGRQLLLGSAGYAAIGFDFLYLGVFAVVFSAVGVVLSWRLLSK